MTNQNALKIFDNKKVRTIWDNEHEKWYISIVDVIAVLTESPNPQVNWRVLKKRLLAEGNQTVTNCNGLKMEAPDGKMRLTDVADVEQVFRLIQSNQNPFNFMVTVGISSKNPTIVRSKINGHAHLNHLLNGTRAISKTPINTPEVGVIRLVNPSPM